MFVLLKVGCPPEAAEEIAAAAREREAWQRAAAGDAHTTRPDPELDQFMVEYPSKPHMTSWGLGIMKKCYSFNYGCLVWSLDT